MSVTMVKKDENVAKIWESLTMLNLQKIGKMLEMESV